MNGHRTQRGLAARGYAALTPHLVAGALMLLAATPILLVAALVPRAAVLPTISLIAIAAAAGAAALAWWRKARRHAATVTLWDVAGAFVLIGCAAAMMSQPENLLQVFAHTQEP